MIKTIAILMAVFFTLLIQKPATAQQDNFDYGLDSSFVDTLDLSIDDYNKYTPILGGKEVRMKEGLKINGMIIDYYPDSTTKHKGYYTHGQLVSTYRNYYQNGELERSFKVSGNFKLVIESFYPNTKPKEYIEYRKGEIIKYVEYYANGNMTTYEEYDKKKGYYLALRNYFPDGKLKSSLELIDAKKKTYYQKEFFPSGGVKEEGPVLYNSAQWDYQRQGSWKVFDESGKLVETQEYYKGELIL